jgi:hypothetical protein
MKYLTRAISNATASDWQGIAETVTRTVRLVAEGVMTFTTLVLFSVCYE